MAEERYIQEWVDTSQTGGEKRKSKEGERIEKNSGEKEKNRETWDTNVLGEGGTRENQRFLRICHRYEAELVSSMPSGKKCRTLSLYFSRFRKTGPTPVSSHFGGLVALFSSRTNRDCSWYTKPCLISLYNFQLLRT